MTRILLADDHQMALSSLSKVIRDANPDWQICYGASDGGEAVVKAAALKPDLVILDFAMPGLDGINAGRRIRALLPDVPIMVYTFMVFPQLERLAKEAGLQSVVEKADASVLVTEIRRLLALNSTPGVSPAATAISESLADAAPGEDDGSPQSA